MPICLGCKTHFDEQRAYSAHRVHCSQSGRALRGMVQKRRADWEETKADSCKRKREQLEEREAAEAYHAQDVPEVLEPLEPLPPNPATVSCAGRVRKAPRKPLTPGRPCPSGRLPCATPLLSIPRQPRHPRTKHLPGGHLSFKTHL
ncbi:hypothetical protein OH77DRAFT_1148618 [Trametes cingulata]|nr:hypothetical protein OH77DRAFT_1148618 [Trametes cingulata]